MYPFDEHRRRRPKRPAIRDRTWGRVLGLTVARFEIDSPRSFTLVFDPGYRLTIFDDSEQYESFEVHIDGTPGIYV